MAKGKGNRIGLWIIVGLLFVGLIGFGSAGLNGGLRSIGTVGDKDLSVARYANAVSDQLDAFSAQIGVPVSFAQAEQVGLPQSVLGQLIADRTIDNEAARLGLSTGDARVLSQVIQNPAFSGIDGQFDRETYAFQLGRRGLSEEQYETQLREGVARTLVQSAVIGGIPEPSAYADALVGYIGERRSITWATLDASAVATDLPDPTEAEVQAHYEANPEAYTSPEVRQITYAWITPDLLRDQIDVDAEMLQALYDERIDEFVIPERRLTERLVYPDADAAEAALASLGDEVSFDDLVADRGLDLSDVDLGDVARDDLGAAADAVFAAEPGDVVGPFDTEFGPALFRVNAVLSAQETSFEEARPDLEDEMATATARRLIADMEDPITDLVAGGAALEDLVERTELQLGQIDFTEETTDDIAAYEAFRTAAAETEEGAFPELVELSDGGLFVLRLDGIIPPALRPLEDVRAQAIEDRRAAAAQEAVVAETARIIGELATTNNFEAVGLEGTFEEYLTRRDFLAGTPEGFMGLVFGMEAAGDVATMETAEGTIIVRLDSIDAANLMDPALEAERAAIAERAANAIAQDVYATYAPSVQLRTDISIVEAAVAAVTSNFR